MMNQTISKTISFVRFPLACLIVYLHYYTPDIAADVVLKGVNGGGTSWSLK